MAFRRSESTLLRAELQGDMRHLCGAGTRKVSSSIQKNRRSRLNAITCDSSYSRYINDMIRNALVAVICVANLLPIARDNSPISVNRVL